MLYDFYLWFIIYPPTCPGGGIGRHKGLKIPRQQWHAGSSPAPGTIYNFFVNMS